MLLNFSGLQSGSPSVKWKEFITYCTGDVASMRELCEMLNMVPASQQVLSGCLLWLFIFIKVKFT